MTRRGHGGVALGLDPGFASFGWSLVRLEPGREEVLDAGVVRTRIGYKKDAVLASSDLHRRGREIVGLLGLVLRREQVTVICAESLSWVRSAKTMQQLGRAWGIVDTLSTLLEVPVVEAAPQEIKEALTGHRDGSKSDVEKAVRKRYPGAWIGRLEEEVPPGQREHAFDSVGAVIACLPSQVCRMARQMRAA